MVSGLVNIDFDTIASMIQQMDPLPSFETARSRLLLEESPRAQEPSVPTQAFVAHADNTHSPTPSTSQSQQSCGGGGGGGGRSGGRGRVGKQNRKGRGKGMGRQQQQQQLNNSQPTIPSNTDGSTSINPLGPSPLFYIHISQVAISTGLMPLLQQAQHRATTWPSPGSLHGLPCTLWAAHDSYGLW